MFLVLDFEATCDDVVKWPEQEIIEFPIVAETGEVFHSYVRPIIHPILTKFCTELTGITQATVDTAASFPDVLAAVREWLVALKEKYPNEPMYFVTCGHWDLRICLPKQCKLAGIPAPAEFTEWINIKEVFSEFYKVPVTGMPSMLAHANLSLDGRHHSGIDDSRNIMKILQRLQADGWVFADSCVSNYKSTNKAKNKPKNY